jgi:hypothetical protein
MNFREKIIREDMETISPNMKALTEWEREFIASVRVQNYPLTQNQFNRIQEIAQRLRREVA